MMAHSAQIKSRAKSRTHQRNRYCKNRKRTKNKRRLLPTSFYFADDDTCNKMHLDADSSGHVDYDSYYDFPLKKTMSLQKHTNTIKKKPKQYHFLNKHQRIILINGYIETNFYYIETKYQFRYADILRVIELYYNDSVFIWKISASDRDCNPVFEPYQWPFSLRLRVWHRSKPLKVHPNGLFGNALAYRAMDCIDLELIHALHPRVPCFIKIYYELYCDEIEKLMFWKGVKKYRLIDEEKRHVRTPHKLLIPRRYLTVSEFKNACINSNGGITIKLFVDVLCVDRQPKGKSFFREITLTQCVRFDWCISNNHSVLGTFRNQSESMLWSKNFDSDNWCLWCRNVKKPTNKKRTKFVIGLMLIKLPWFYNYIQVQCVVRCNDNKNKKTLIRNVWPGFESSLQIPFKYEILRQSSTINITVRLKILKVFDIKNKQVCTSQFTNWR
eukprot:76364_1